MVRMIAARRLCSSLVSEAHAENSRARHASQGETRCRGWAAARAARLNLDTTSRLSSRYAEPCIVQPPCSARYPVAAIAGALPDPDVTSSLLKARTPAREYPELSSDVRR